MHEQVIPLLSENILCDHCLGRQFALLGYGLTNDQRGQILKDAAMLALYDKIDKNEEALEGMHNAALMGNKLAINSLKRKDKTIPSSEEAECELCEGIFNRLDIYVEEITSKLAKEEYDSYLIGAKFFPELLEREDMLRAKYGITTGESIKSEFTREVGKSVGEIINKPVDFKLPDITIIIDLPNQKITLQRRALYIYGRYRKLIRTIPQTKWPCSACQGEGCEECNQTGKLYQESVEEIIAEPILEVTKGEESKFHGAGREDIDALMIGNGRPFVIEILEPQKRSINLEKIEQAINQRETKKIEVEQLAFSDKETIHLLKEKATETRKTYRAKVELEKEITKEQIQQLEEKLTGAEIHQQTPQRVLHRRGDKTRTRRVYEINVRQTGPKELEAEVTTEGGLYIKELISSDEGRTEPSFTSILGVQATCQQLDVIKFHRIHKNREH
ncbi:MAG: tRNA pseudouridine(54/55) synthase Pus10 [Candidatus Heimdallarchaeota archaeon]|nr:tRNA pseudouridine(54/55) synthase Pus10 [Candidatus Heimdallarchaeota archaeon]